MGSLKVCMLSTTLESCRMLAHTYLSSSNCEVRIEYILWQRSCALVKPTFFFFSLQNRVYVGLVVLKLHLLARLQLKDIACLCLPSARSEGVPLGPASKTNLKKKWFLHSTQPHSILWHHASEPHQDPNTHSLMDRECSEADAVDLFCAPKNVVKGLDRHATDWAMDLPMCRGKLCLLWFIDFFSQHMLISQRLA